MLSFQIKAFCVLLISLFILLSSCSTSLLVCHNWLTLWIFLQAPGKNDKDLTSESMVSAVPLLILQVILQSANYLHTCTWIGHLGFTHSKLIHACAHLLFLFIIGVLIYAHGSEYFVARTFWKQWIWCFISWNSLEILASTSEKIEILRHMCYFSHSKCLNWWTRMKLRKVSSFSLPILLWSLKILHMAQSRCAKVLQHLCTSLLYW